MEIRIMRPSEFFRSVARLFGIRIPRRRPVILRLPPDTW